MVCRGAEAPRSFLVWSWIVVHPYMGQTHDDRDRQAKDQDQDERSCPSDKMRGDDAQDEHGSNEPSKSRITPMLRSLSAPPMWGGAGVHPSTVDCSPHTRVFRSSTCTSRMISGNWFFKRSADSKVVK